MWPRVDPVQAIDAQLRDLAVRMSECDNPIAYEVLERQLDNLLDRRLQLKPCGSGVKLGTPAS